MKNNCRVYGNDSWEKVHMTISTEEGFYEFNVFLPENDLTLFQILKITDEVEYHRSIYFLHVETVEGAKRQIEAFVESKECGF